MTTQLKNRFSQTAVAWGLGLLCSLFAGAALAAPGAIWTSLNSGQTVNSNLYDTKPDVYLNGGPNGGGVSGNQPSSKSAAGFSSRGGRKAYTSRATGNFPAASARPANR